MKDTYIYVRCPKCTPRKYAKPLRWGRISQGPYGNCARCFRQLVKVAR